MSYEYKISQFKPTLSQSSLAGDGSPAVPDGISDVIRERDRVKEIASWAADMLETVSSRDGSGHADLGAAVRRMLKSNNWPYSSMDAAPTPTDDGDNHD